MRTPGNGIRVLSLVVALTAGDAVARDGMGEDQGQDQVEPTAQQMQQALEFGRLFQQMAPRQNSPQSGLPIPFDYYFSPCEYARRPPTRFYSPDRRPFCNSWGARSTYRGGRRPLVPYRLRPEYMDDRSDRKR